MSTIAATSKRHHYPALDGLRGVAVAAVVGYHLWPAVAPGGWIGVSLFFTLSGFLIVGLVDRGIAAGEFDGHVFYARRARRLLPAAGVTFAAVLVATWISQPELLDRVRGDVVASVAYVANWRQAADPGGYEAIFDLEPRPLGHIWSLAIEEQVYLVVPGLLVLTRRPVLVLSGLAAVGSAGLWFWWGDADLYFATPVRALEVLAGGALALVVNRRGIPRIPAGPVLGLGLPAMLLLAGTVAETDVVPHPWILPAMAVGLWVPLVAAALSGSGPLESRSLRWLGERSYGVYLFHWPLIELTGWHPVVILGVTLALAEVSYTLVEMPVRMGSLVRTAPISRLLGATSVVALVAAAAPLVSPAVEPASAEEALALVEGPAPAPGPDSGGLVSTEGDRALVVGGPVAERPDPASVEPRRGDPPILATRPRTVLLVGDSTAMRIEEPLRLWGAERGIEVTARASMACTPVARSWEIRLGFADLPFFAVSDCPPGPDDLAVDAVVVVHHGTLAFRHRLPGKGDEGWVSLADDAELRAAVIDAYTEIADLAEAPVILTTVPAIDLDAESLDPAAVDPANELLRDLADERDDVALIDSSPVERDPDRYGRDDGLHLDPLGAAAYVVDVLGPVLAPDAPADTAATQVAGSPR